MPLLHPCSLQPCTTRFRTRFEPGASGGSLSNLNDKWRLCMRIHMSRTLFVWIVLAALVVGVCGTLAGELTQRDPVPSTIVPQPSSRVTVSGQLTTFAHEDDRVFAGTWCCQKVASSDDGKSVYEGCSSTGVASACPLNGLVGADCRGDTQIVGTTVTCFHGKK